MRRTGRPSGELSTIRLPLRDRYPRSEAQPAEMHAQTSVSKAMKPSLASVVEEPFGERLG